MTTRQQGTRRKPADDRIVSGRGVLQAEPEAVPTRKVGMGHLRRKGRPRRPPRGGHKENRRKAGELSMIRPGGGQGKGART
ncbi:hypothetical protein APZ00_01115 [Pannonibacter phragmitetus]|uniref:Uncharacterized protein n=1 Tax=Pannonibacter phragmitetus TaxID=121719 RepID=A0A0U3PF68_9HYPH|nr:hypothetical protein APZ00_01115 [Pannonibacter phragmitetus]